MTGLVRYDAMCKAIAACHTVDEVKEIRDKARALEVYAQQALNTEAEHKACEIRIRAERKAGELLREMKQNGARQNHGRPKTNKKSGTKKRSDAPTISDLGMFQLKKRRQSDQVWRDASRVTETDHLVRTGKLTAEPIVQS